MGRRIDIAGGTANFLSRTAEVFSIGGTDSRPLSINLWHRPESLSVSIGTMFANEQVGAPSVAMILDGGTFRFYSGVYGPNATPPLSGLISADVWSMFTVTWAANGDYRLYINGVERTAGNLARTFTSDTGNSAIGNLNGNFGAFFSEGDYAEFAAWDSVLTSAQVASMYTGAEAGQPATAVGSPAHYVPLLGSSSPEPETTGGGSWTIVGSVPASVAIGSSPPHPIIAVPGVQLNPDGTVSNTNWSAVGAASLHAALAAGDSDYITASVAGAVSEVSLTNPSPLLDLTDASFTIRARLA